ncbi:BA75_03943T0 [Komagataella pastoris]|uniref:BA75_03943T0 n=1 Tax=Komagataella pastoris TaxID=4922 RepID=A0A1B2JFV4_PICPA|nr:BA75_03943T0 [Komagataella pastoris]
MVLWYKNQHIFNHDFTTVSLAYLNRYPNPYSTHVLSIDTLNKHIDKDGKLHQTKLITKTGRLPQWVKPFLGKISHSNILEMTVIDPESQTMNTYTRNLDHTRIIRIEEYTTFQYDKECQTTTCKSKVKFSSGFRGFGVKNRIEKWSHTKFDENISKSRQGLKFVMENIKYRLNNRTLSNI